MILPVPGVGNGLPVVVSNTYMRPLLSNTNPSMAVKPVAAISICPLGSNLVNVGAAVNDGKQLQGYQRKNSHDSSLFL